jgi:hypothetical protein
MWYTGIRSGRTKPLPGLDFRELPESSILSGSTSQSLESPKLIPEQGLEPRLRGIRVRRLEPIGSVDVD